ncbi:hypothetical protein VSX64_24405 [Aurantimonas sp. C2-6-R+9]|uniref:hypothetical protein n=1 Tax=unclassified Aurantimonas TaxID=2638230 RepID=UPI002E1951F6|nr:MULTISPECIES: hypothetical protein [unclassified Aurantimonas]MEC5291915.1 hypothetical protein [Aurantimonas sp. C2-3-R2]MEC5383865.1 hypothetical protein [Aurantimonas sp. C2-6-R+9]MEC5413001.1 hypothetical protein [Aurantimonas sp. C2-4-R8]
MPEPKPGLVIRYSFLWSHERDRGAVEGSKDRPCAIVVATPRDENGHIRTIVAPITHRPPDDAGASLEIPPDVCRTLGLDAGRHWLRLDELNRFLWPGYDLRLGPRGRYDYGMLPPRLFEDLRQGILTRQRGRRTAIMSRDD